MLFVFTEDIYLFILSKIFHKSNCLRVVSGGGLVA